jgi:dTDP-4-amino-4,6-dideoxygalactose transaminase
MSEAIPFLDLRRLHESIRPELTAAFDRVVADAAFVGSGAVAAFEAAFAVAHGRRVAASCGSGTDALVLTLRAVGVGAGDEVVVPAMTFIATLEAVVHVGATPVIADVDPRTLLLSEETVDAVRTPRTRAVVPVHLYGHVVPFPTLQQWREEGLLVVEDAAQAHLASWEGQPVGSVGHAACFSFYPGKNLGALGDGGAVVSDDEEVVDRIRRLRDHGRLTKYEHEEIGWCSRLDGLQAAFLDVKLRHLRKWNDRRRSLARRYRERLGSSIVPWSPGAVHHLLVVRVPADRRSEVAESLGAAGIGTGVHYPVPLSRQPSCRPYARPCPVAELAATEVLSLPMDPLMADEDVDRVCDLLGPMIITRD